MWGWVTVVYRELNGECSIIIRVCVCVCVCVCPRIKTKRFYFIIWSSTNITVDRANYLHRLQKKKKKSEQNKPIALCNGLKCVCVCTCVGVCTVGVHLHGYMYTADGRARERECVCVCVCVCVLQHACSWKWDGARRGRLPSADLM